MIAADTNILARVILEDDNNQTKIARHFLEKHTKEENLYLSPFMFLELAWLLKSKGISRHEIALILEKIVHSSGTIIGHKNILVAAIHLYSKANVSFADCLITMDAKLSVNAKTATFDQALRKADSNCILPT